MKIWLGTLLPSGWPIPLRHSTAAGCTENHPSFSQIFCGIFFWDFHGCDWNVYLVGGDWNMKFLTFHSVGNGKSSQLTFTQIFQRGRWLNHQPVMGV